MGPWVGPLGIMLGLPGVCYLLVYTCNAGGEHWPLTTSRLAEGLAHDACLNIFMLRVIHCAHQE